MDEALPGSDGPLYVSRQCLFAELCPDPDLREQLAPDSSFTAIVGPDGRHQTEPVVEGEGMVVADLDLQAITRRKLRMDSVGHYARPDIVRMLLDPRPQSVVEKVALRAESPVPSESPPLVQYQEIAARLVEIEEKLRTLAGE